MTPTSTTERLLLWWLRRFYRTLFGALGLGFGLLWAVLGLRRALLVAALALLGYLAGKWMDDGRPDMGLSARLRRLFDEP
ncbi:MAG TPA: DUF2273 domain-containing protein [bacterium]|jgi:hypothetical protein|nr:DUF2273 domain-containing protein [bacterium]